MHAHRLPATSVVASNLILHITQQLHFISIHMHFRRERYIQYNMPEQKGFYTHNVQAVRNIIYVILSFNLNVRCNSLREVSVSHNCTDIGLLSLYTSSRI